jgi:CheY-like chemotaxis protein
MRHRVQDIVLVASLYDSFILSEDGKLHELFLDEFLELDLHYTPGLTSVSSGEEALALAREQSRYNLIISSMHLGDMSVLDLARKLREEGLNVPSILLGYDNRDLTDFVNKNDVSDIDKIFLWQGDVRILLAIVKYIEDKMNVAHDTGMVGVQTVIVIEDNIRFYSSFLPMIYTELVKHSHGLLPEGINHAHKIMRIRARPKILLCSTYEEAWHYFSSYPDETLGIISDIEFPREGKLDHEAGVRFATAVRDVRPDVPMMLQSSHPRNEKLARKVGASFLLKGSPVLLNQLRKFMVESFGFGDFVFRMPGGGDVGRANDLKSLEHQLHTVPLESIGYHAERHHFSNWLKMRTEFSLAHRLRPRQVSDYPTLEDLRQDLISSLHRYRRDRNRGMVADFDRATFDASSSFTRIGSGSLGGKARGLAFINVLLNEYGVDRHFPGVNIAVPPSVVIGTEAFDRFLDDNDLRDFAIGTDDDDEINKRFLDAPFPEDIRQDLYSFLELIQYPLAVRSSSLLEDSQYQPFAGIYETYMLPNHDQKVEVRLEQLIDAIKRVYASTFSGHAKAYLRATPYRLEEEKMAVIVQKLVGSVHRDRFYPDFAGVARSHNFYPTAPMTSEDGVAAVALGLGKTVCEGETCIRFCPKYPRHLVQFSSVKDVLQNSQRHFYALELKDGSLNLDGHGGVELVELGLEAAEEDGTLAAVGATYSPENDAIYDGLSRPGVRLVNFAPVLKFGRFPLAEILDLLLKIGEHGTQGPVELEFAVNLKGENDAQNFGFLQIRPLALSREVEELELDELEPPELICRSSTVLGHGKITGLRDIVVVDFHRFERLQSRDVASAVARFNNNLSAEGTPYLLIGVGRWGSSDPFLGIPVTWDQIAGVRVIVEAGFRDFRVTPSQGTHFFQNLTSCRVGYFTVNPEVGEGFVDWEWLADQPAVSENGCVRHLRFSSPISVSMDGKRNQGIISKPIGVNL